MARRFRDTNAMACRLPYLPTPLKALNVEKCAHFDELKVSENACPMIENNFFEVRSSTLNPFHKPALKRYRAALQENCVHEDEECETYPNTQNQ